MLAEVAGLELHLGEQEALAGVGLGLILERLQMALQILGVAVVAVTQAQAAQAAQES